MKPILRVPLVILVTAAAISLGVVGVEASTQCVRFIQRKVRHHKVSAATAAKWKAWDKAHPNWHPKPTPPETLAQIDFACKVPLEAPPTMTAELPPIDLGPLVMPLQMTAPEPPVVVADNQPPQDFFPSQPSESLVTPPIYSPQYPNLFGGIPIPETTGPPPPVGPSPEPSTWMLLATGLLSIAGLSWKRRQTAASVQTA